MCWPALALAVCLVAIAPSLSAQDAGGGSVAADRAAKNRVVMQERVAVRAEAEALLRAGDEKQAERKLASLATRGGGGGDEQELFVSGDLARLAFAAAERGDEPKHALKLARHALRLMREEKLATVVDVRERAARLTLAAALHERVLQDKAAAARLFERACAVDPKNAQAINSLARLRGEAAEARLRDETAARDAAVWREVIATKK